MTSNEEACDNIIPTKADISRDYSDSLYGIAKKVQQLDQQVQEFSKNIGTLIPTIAFHDGLSSMMNSYRICSYDDHQQQSFQESKDSIVANEKKRSCNDSLSIQQNGNKKKCNNATSKTSIYLGDEAEAPDKEGQLTIL